MKVFSTWHYQGAWFEFSGDRTALRSAIEAHLRQALQDPTGRLEVGESGPFWISAEKVHLSYSHTSGWAVLVFSKLHEIGVDLESASRKMSESPLRIAERYFHEAEQATLLVEKSNPDRLHEAFLDLWLKKEAYGKLTRKGLRDSIHLKIDSIPGVRFETIPVIPEGYRAQIAYPVS